MAENNDKKYAGANAVTEVIKAIRQILGNVSSAGIEAEGNVITGGGQNIVSALFALDSELSKKGYIFRIEVVQVGDDKYVFNRSLDEIKEAYNNGFAIYVEDRAIDKISVYDEWVTISVSDSYTFTAGGTQEYYKTYGWNSAGELSISENSVDLLTYGDGSKFLSDDGKYKEVPAIKEYGFLPTNSDSVRDANMALESGNYYVNPNDLNVPFNGFGVLSMQKTKQNDVWYQLAVNYYNNNTYIRCGNIRDGVMSIIRDWKKVATEDDIKIYVWDVSTLPIADTSEIQASLLKPVISNYLQGKPVFVYDGVNTLPTSITYNSEYWTITLYTIDSDSSAYGYFNFPYNILDLADDEYVEVSYGGTPEKLVQDYEFKSALNKKQDTLVSGTNIKTINGQSILGSGNITIEGSSSSGGSGAYPQVDANPDGEVLVTIVIEPNKFYLFGDVVTLDIGFGEETEGVANEYLFQFSSGSSEATTLLLPNSVKWANDEVPTIETNMIYQVSILNGLATMLAFSNTPELDTFFISGYTSYEYQCVPGMTWEEWINSEYNVDGYFVNSGYVHQSSSYRIRNNGVDVLATDTIIANNTYNMYYYD